MSRTRTFVALPLPAAQRRAVGDLVEQLAHGTRGVRWVPEENLHVTLAFLGDLAEGERDRVAEAVREAAARHAPFPLALRGVGAFPGPRRPRVLWVGCAEGEAEAVALHRSVTAALEPLGHEPDPRPFTPHATIGRVKGRGVRVDVSDPELRGWDGGRWQVEEVRVMGSVTRPGGAEHSVVVSCPLGG